ncbi:SGNH/GDSL hydrolase family protein [Desulfitobacterium sp. AusDCA]|uniref:SGNH/GDSL hydrolase family protein n=1 Tax=Desulfitobacterium sp. AusDCA TaxID=3240383 RepID=UPI003DA75753
MNYKKVDPIITGVFLIVFLLSVVSYTMIATPIATHGMKKIKTGVIKAVVLGDSIALSARATNPSTTGWTADLDSEIRNVFPVGKIQWTMLGLNGSGIDYALKRSSELTKDTDVVYICTGRNDAQGYLYAAFKKKYTELITTIKKTAPHADIICIIEPPMVSADDTTFTATRKAILASVQETRVLVVDTWAQFPKDNKQLGTFLYDGLHPNDSGYQIISKCIFDTMRNNIEK